MVRLSEYLPIFLCAAFPLFPNVHGQDFSVQTVVAGIQLTWDAEPGHEYTVWWSKTLDPPAWVEIHTIPLVVKPQASFFDAEPADRHAFYRIEKKRPMILVPGSDGGGVDYNFYIGKYEVTNAEFAGFLDSFQTRLLPYHNGRQRICRLGKPYYRSVPITGQEDHPVVYVSCWAAMAYCNWLSEQEGMEKVYDEEADWQPDITKNGYRLPTDSEWYKAACWDPTKNGTGGFWRYACRSDSMRGTLSNYADSGDPFEGVPAGDLGNPPFQTTPVGFYNGSQYTIFFASYADEPSFQTEEARTYYGCYDMSGNAAEFVMLYEQGSFWSRSMGSSWGSFDPLRWDISFRWPGDESGGLGFRLARTAK